MLIQNTAAAYWYCGMIAMHDGMQAAGMRSCIIMQVHDSIVLDVCSDELEFVAKQVKSVMEHPFLARAGVLDFDVPMVCDVEAGPSWGTMLPIDISYKL